jgi:hypothetical protein
MKSSDFWKWRRVVRSESTALYPKPLHNHRPESLKSYTMPLHVSTFNRSSSGLWSAPVRSCKPDSLNAQFISSTEEHSSKTFQEILFKIWWENTGLHWFLKYAQLTVMIARNKPKMAPFEEWQFMRYLEEILHADEDSHLLYRGLYQRHKRQTHAMLSRVWVTLYVVSDWILDLPTTLIHNSQLHLLIAPSLISAHSNH